MDCVQEFDGASRGNPGPAGAGAALLESTDGSQVSASSMRPECHSLGPTFSLLPFAGWQHLFETRHHDQQPSRVLWTTSWLRGMQSCGSQTNICSWGFTTCNQTGGFNATHKLLMCGAVRSCLLCILLTALSRVYCHATINRHLSTST